MKKKLIFISWFLLFSLSLFPLVSCSISETQNLNQKINEQNSVKDIVMNVETKYKISPGGYYGFDALNIVTVTDESKNTNFNNKDKLQQLFFPNGNWKELIKSNESNWKTYRAENFSDINLFKKFFEYAKNFENISQKALNPIPFDKNDINFNNISNEYVNGYMEIITYSKDAFKMSYVDLYFSLSDEKVWLSTKKNYYVLFRYNIFPEIESTEKN